MNQVEGNHYESKRYIGGCTYAGGNWRLTKVTLIVWPFPGLKKMSGRKGEPEWRGTVKIIQLERVRVRSVPGGMFREAAIRSIAESRSF